MATKSSKPSKRHTSESYITDKTRYTLTDVFEKFGSSLPRMFLVKKGYSGSITEKPLVKGQVLRLQCTSSKERLAGRALTKYSKIQYFSFYEHTSVLVNTTRGDQHGQSIEAMMEGKTLPVTVSIKRSLDGVSEATQLQFLNYFEERHLVGNLMYSDFFDNDILYIPTYLPRVRLVEILGLRHEPAQAWTRYKKRCSDIATLLSEYDTQFTRIHIAVHDEVRSGRVTSTTSVQQYIHLKELHDMCMTEDMYISLVGDLQKTKADKGEEMPEEDDIYVEVSALYGEVDREDTIYAETVDEDEEGDEGEDSDDSQKKNDRNAAKEYDQELAECESKSEKEIPKEKDTSDIKDDEAPLVQRPQQMQNVTRESGGSEQRDKPPLPPRGTIPVPSSTVVLSTLGESFSYSKYSNDIPRATVTSFSKKKENNSDSDEGDYETVTPDDKKPPPVAVKPTRPQTGPATNTSDEKSLSYKSENNSDSDEGDYETVTPDDKKPPPVAVKPTRPQTGPATNTSDEKSLSYKSDNKVKGFIGKLLKQPNKIYGVSQDVYKKPAPQNVSTGHETPTNPEKTVVPSKIVKNVTGSSKVESGDDVRNLSIEQVCDCLHVLRLDKLEALFRKEMVDGVILASLNTDTFRNEFGLSRLEAARLENFAKSGHLPI